MGNRKQPGRPAVWSWMSLGIGLVWCLLAGPTQAAGGDFDTSFGAGLGYVTLGETYTANWGISNGIALADGSALVAGNAVSRFYVRRYTPDGTLVRDFGTDGTVEIPEFESRWVSDVFPTLEGGATLASGGLVRRLTPQGRLDVGYRPKELILGYGSKLAPLPDGRIVTVSPSGWNEEVVWQFFLANGERDLSRGDSSGELRYVFPKGQGQLSLVVQEDGKPLLATAFERGGEAGLALLRLDADGRPDASFGSEGLVLLSRPSRAREISLAVGSDGRIALASSHNDAPYQWVYHISVLGRDGRPTGLPPHGGDIQVPLSAGETYRDQGQFAIVSPPPRLAVASRSAWWQMDLDVQVSVPPPQLRRSSTECPILWQVAYGGGSLWRFCRPTSQAGEGERGMALAVPTGNFVEQEPVVIADQFLASYFERLQGLHLFYGAITAVHQRSASGTTYGMLRYSADGARNLFQYQPPLDELDLDLIVAPQVLRPGIVDDFSSMFLVDWFHPRNCAFGACTFGEVWRLRSNGSPDSDFGAEGKVYLPGEGSWTARNYSAWRRPDGGFFSLAAYQSSWSTPKVGAVVAAFGSDGRPDASFASSPRELGPLANGQYVGIGRVAALPDGRVQALISTEGETVTLKVVHWLADGHIDSGQPSEGMSLPLPTPKPAALRIAEMDQVPLTDGSTLVALFLQDAGHPSLPKSHRRVLLRLSPEGQLDGAFGQGGYVLIDSGAFPGIKLHDNPHVVRLAVQTDGKIILGHTWPQGGATAIAIERYHASGLPDETFAAGGGHRALASIAGAEVLSDLLLLPRENPLVSEGLLIGGASQGRGLLARLLGASTVTPAAPVIEFFNNQLKHYFITGGAGEIAAIDSGAAGPGWQRTGLSFKPYAPGSGNPPGAQPVCRFYGTPGLGPNSHFYTVDPLECEGVRRDPGWTYEGTAFYIVPPASGQCATGTQPVYRAYNTRFAQNDSNHRYTTDAAVYAQMQAQGWAGEGAVFCAAQ